MDDAAFVVTWNQSGVRGCMQRFNLSQWSVGYHVRRLRAKGHTLKEWKRTGRPAMRDRHARISDLWRRLSMEEIAELTGLSMAQVRYSVNVVREKKGAKSR